MKRTLTIAVLAVILGLAALAGAWSTDTRQSFSLDVAAPIILDFDSAIINVLAWSESHIAVTFSHNAARDGLQGDIKQVGNTLTLENFVAPARTPVKVRYSADAWLPIMQFERYRNPLAFLPPQAVDADYTVYVPRDSVIGIRAGTVLVSECNIFRIEAGIATVTDSHLSDYFVGTGTDMLIRRSSGADFVTLYGGNVTIRDSSFNEINIRSNKSSLDMRVDMRGLTAATVGIHAAEPHRYFVTVDEASLQILNLFYGGSTHTTVRDVVSFSAGVKPVQTP